MTEKKTEEAKAEAKKEEKKAVKLEGKLGDLMKSIETMTVLELSEFVKALEDKFGVSAAMPAMVAGVAAGGAAAGGVEAAEEKTSFTVVLTSTGGNKIAVIKEVRTVTSLGLKEAKDLVDSAPKPVKEGVSKEEAEEIKKKLIAVGATVELK